MNIAIVGSRNFTDYQYMKETINSHLYFEVNDINYIISGGAKGADTLAERYAKEHNIPIKIFPAQWETFGRSAGYRRNIEIIKNADLVFAFWDGISKGTKHSIDLARKEGKKVFIYYFKKDVE